MEVEKKKEIVKQFIQKGILLSEDILEVLDSDDSPEAIVEQIQQKIPSDDFLILNKDLKTILHLRDNIDIDFKGMDKSKAKAEKKDDDKLYKGYVDFLKRDEDGQIRDEETIKEDTEVKIIKTYQGEERKRTVKDFVSYFNKRYKKIEEMLRFRNELQNVTSIIRVLGKKEREQTAIIGMVVDKRMTKNENIQFTIEDNTGRIKVLVNKNKPELHEQAKEITEDEVIGVTGSNGENIIFANNVIWPDIPVNKELKKSPTEGYAIFLSDLHVGSINFLPDKFDKFLKWIRGELGNEKQKETASKIKYCFIAGDLVDGVGIYPDQEKELNILDIKKQYEECANLLSKIPERIQIIIIPGNHDAMRLAEPQPPLYQDFAKPIWDMPNTTILSNPCIVNIDGTKDFQGFNVLMYHGYSYIYYADSIDTIRLAGGIDRSDLIMKFWLKRRHLAPTYKSNTFIPETTEDPLVIDKIPDFMVTGHIHKAMISNYRNVTMICGSCWQERTSFEEKMGLHPEPAKIPLVNLQTREVRILNFDK